MENKIITKEFTAENLVEIEKIKFTIGILENVRRSICNNKIDKDAMGLEIAKLHIDHEIMQLQRDLLDIGSIK